MSERCSAELLKKLVVKYMPMIPQDLSSAAKGTMLCSLVTKELRAMGLETVSLDKLHVGRSFKTFRGFSLDLALEEIESFVLRRKALTAYRPALEQMFWRVTKRGVRYKRKIGRLIPDLIVELPDGSLLVWDLTSKTVDEHIAKTQLYAEVAAVSRGVEVHVVEFHWDPPAPLSSGAARAVTDSRADRFLSPK